MEARIFLSLYVSWNDFKFTKWPIDQDHPTLDCLDWNRADGARIVRGRAVISDDKNVTVWDLGRWIIVTAKKGYPRFIKCLTVDKCMPFIRLNDFSWEADYALNQVRTIGLSNDDDISSLRFAEIVTDLLSHHAVASV